MQPYRYRCCLTRRYSCCWTLYFELEVLKSTQLRYSWPLLDPVAAWQCERVLRDGWSSIIEDAQFLLSRVLYSVYQIIFDGASSEKRKFTVTCRADRPAWRSAPFIRIVIPPTLECVWGKNHPFTFCERRQVHQRQATVRFGDLGENSVVSEYVVQNSTCTRVSSRDNWSCAFLRLLRFMWYGNLTHVLVSVKW